MCAAALGTAAAHETLTNASAVLALTAQQATSNIPISITGVVTAAETNSNWGGRFFVQDASGGVFVNNLSLPQPVPGAVVEVTGVSHPGGYAPVITKPHWKQIGVAPLPAAKPVTSECLMSGAADGQRVEISGIVRTAQPSGNRVGLEIVTGGYRFRAFLPPRPDSDLQSLVGAKVLLRGTAAAAFNAPLRHFLTITLLFRSPRMLSFKNPRRQIPSMSPPCP